MELSEVYQKKISELKERGLSREQIEEELCRFEDMMNRVSFVKYCGFSRGGQCGTYKPT
jgi:orotate phosphoribosyltransferase-like protein